MLHDGWKTLCWLQDFIQNVHNASYVYCHMRGKPEALTYCY